ncbi:MAG: DoxX family protein [Mycobacterium sp.]
MPTARQYSDPLTRNDIGLLVLRVAVGAVLCWNGVEALFGSSAHPPTDLAARVLVGAYTIGGAMLVVGVLTPFGACAVLASMLYMGLHSYSTRSALGLPPDWDAIKFPLMLGLGAISVILLGSGDMSVDGRFGRTQWPTVVSTMLVVAGIGAAIAAWVLVGDTNPFS